MIKHDVVWSHVEALLERMLGVDSVAHDDGAWPIRTGHGAYTVRVNGPRHPHVEVFAVALHDLAMTREAFLEVNDLNARSSHVRWFLDADRLIVASELVGGTLDYEELVCVCEEVRCFINEVVPGVAQKIDGKLPYADSYIGESADLEPAAIGMYL